MRKAAGFALTLGFAGYLAVSVSSNTPYSVFLGVHCEKAASACCRLQVIGYLAFGNEVPDNILTAFENPK